MSTYNLYWAAFILAWIIYKFAGQLVLKDGSKPKKFERAVVAVIYVGVAACAYVGIAKLMGVEI